MRIGNEKNGYERNEVLQQYLALHYEDTLPINLRGYIKENIIGFPTRCAKLILHHMKNKKTSRALDIGCAVGGACFELSRKFDQVIGIDLSESFINAAINIQKTGQIIYHAKLEGEICQEIKKSIDTTIERNRVIFSVMDAQMASKSKLGTFDAILAANLLCRLSQPREFLENIHNLLNHQGLLVLTTPCSWSEVYTKKSDWMGGKYRKNEILFTEQEIFKILNAHFELLEKKEMLLLIPEHSRKFELVSPVASVWRKKSP